VAQRLLDGEVLNRQVQDVHPGYLSFLNAAALAVFGVDLVSLRYPLVAAGFAAACLVFRQFPPARPVAALIASVSLTALGVLNFLDPTANWYCLFLLVGLAGLLAWLPRGPTRLLAVGLVLGALGMFRQLSGAFVAPGVLAYLLLEERAQPGQQAWPGRLALGVAALALAGYLAASTDLAGWLLFGLWPLLALGWIARDVAIPPRRVLAILGLLAAGALTATLPLWLYHLVHASTRAWLRDVCAGGLALTHLDFRRQWLYGRFALAGLTALISRDPGRTLDGLYWLAMLLAAAGNGAVVLAALRRRETPPPLSFLAVFYAPVSLYYQIPVYLHYSAALSLVGLLLASGGRRRWSWALGAVVVLLAAVGLRFHAGQPLAGSGQPPVSAQPMPRAHLRIDPAERERYLELLAVIDQQARSDETIFVLPNNPELYFLSGRRNPVRFFNTALGITSDDDLRRAVKALEEQPPRLVIYNPGDKYGTIYSRRLMDSLRARYAPVRAVGGLQFYRRP
jgi:hypothetical protein